MAKIGRNEKCPCQSGKKFKYCCALKKPGIRPQKTQQQTLMITLMGAVKKIQQEAVNKTAVIHELGVFFFFSTEKGDAWLMEMTECDCVQIAKDGVALDAPIDENSETIEINWSHTFTAGDNYIELTDYADKTVRLLENSPGRELNAAMKGIRNKYSEEQLKKVHIPHPEESTIT